MIVVFVVPVHTDVSAVVLGLLSPASTALLIRLLLRRRGRKEDGGRNGSINCGVSEKGFLLT